jgi:epoxyqueuosine reductase
VLSDLVKRLAAECGFELAGVARAEPLAEAGYYAEWTRAGMAGEMGYLTGRRGEMRADPRTLLRSARSLICVGKLYNTPGEAGLISRYALGRDYHDVMRAALERLVEGLRAEAGPFESRIFVDTAPLLERAYARRAGLGWIGRNTCLIHQGQGSWFFLGEVLVSLAIEPDSPPPDRCGSCTRCIDQCPTAALVPTGRPDPAWALDSRRCISYLTIELRGPVPDNLQEGIGERAFGCDICQDVCPWNRRAPFSGDPAFARRDAPPLEELAQFTPEQFRKQFEGTPVLRARHAGFVRNAAIALANRRSSHSSS